MAHFFKKIISCGCRAVGRAVASHTRDLRHLSCVVSFEPPASTECQQTKISAGWFFLNSSNCTGKGK